jgi:hypothetical protein
MRADITLHYTIRGRTHKHNHALKTIYKSTRMLKTVKDIVTESSLLRHLSMYFNVTQVWVILIVMYTATVTYFIASGIWMLWATQPVHANTVVKNSEIIVELVWVKSVWWTLRYFIAGSVTWPSNCISRYFRNNTCNQFYFQCQMHRRRSTQTDTHN